MAGGGYFFKGQGVAARATGGYRAGKHEREKGGGRRQKKVAHKWTPFAPILGQSAAATPQENTFPPPPFHSLSPKVSIKLFGAEP